MSKIKKPDNSIYAFTKSKIKRDLKLKELPFTEKQLQFINLVTDKETKIIICDSPAGTSKTILAVYCSLLLLNMRKISDIYYIRSTVQSKDGETGHLPGLLEEKMQYFNAPLIEKLEELLSNEDVKFLQNDGRIHTLPTSMVRGRSLAGISMILDEAQNTMFETLVTVSTRMGEFSKLFILGDSKQNDLGQKSGFTKFYNIFNDEESKQNGIHTFKFTSEDILRSALAKYIVKKLESLHSSDKMFA